MKIFTLIFRKMKRDWLAHHGNRWIRYIYSSAESGDRHSQFQLARLYETGTKLMEKNLIYAYVLYYISDKKGVTKASDCLEALRGQMPILQWQEAQNIISRLDESEIIPPSTFPKLLKKDDLKIF